MKRVQKELYNSKVAEYKLPKNGVKQINGSPPIMPPKTDKRCTHPKSEALPAWTWLAYTKIKEDYDDPWLYMALLKFQTSSFFLKTRCVDEAYATEMKCGWSSQFLWGVCLKYAIISTALTNQTSNRAENVIKMASAEFWINPSILVRPRLSSTLNVGWRHSVLVGLICG